MNAEAEKFAADEVLMKTTDPCNERGAKKTVEVGEALISTTTEVCAEVEEAQSMLDEAETCKCECKQVDMQALEIFKNQAAALEEVNKKVTEMHQSQVLAWNTEKERFLELISDLEIRAVAKDEEVQVLQERLSMADCAVEQVQKTRVDLQGELHRMQSEMSLTHDKLTELEHAALSLQKVKEEEIGSLSAALHAKSIALDSAQAGLADKERIIHELSAQLSSLHDAQRQCCLMQQESSSKTKDMQILSESHQGLKNHLQAVIEGHEREMDCINCKLQEALDSHASKDLHMEALKSEVHGLQLALTNVKVMTNKAELESSALEKDLGIARETLYNNQLTLEKAIEEVAALREALKAKDAIMEKHRIEQIDNEKAQQQKIESLQQELEKCKSAEKELLLALEKEQKTVTALEDLRKKELNLAKNQENSWTDEREKLIVDLSGKHDLIELKGVHQQELERKLSRADDAIRQVVESRAVLQGEVSELKMQLQNVQMELRDAESALESLEKAKKDEVMSLSNVLHARLMDLETSRQEAVQHQKMITALTDDVAKSRELCEKVTYLERTLKMKEEEVYTLSSSQEQSKLQLKALQDEYRKDTNDLVAQLDRALVCKARTEQRLQECETKLGYLHAALETASVSKAESETDLKVLQDSLARLQEEKCLLQHNLQVQEEQSKIETEALKEFISRRENDLKELKQHIADVEVKLSHAMQQEQKWQEEAVESEALREELKQKCLLHRELLESHQKEVLHWSGKESNWLTEMENLMTRACSAEESLTRTEGQLQTSLSDLQCLSLKYEEREQKMATCQGQIAQLHRQLDESNMQLLFKEQESQNLQDKLRVTSSNLTALSHEQDSALSEAKKKIKRLESEAHLQSTEFAACSNHIEALKRESYLYEVKIRELEETVAHLKESLSKNAEEFSGATMIRAAVEASLVNTREELTLAKRESELEVQTLKDMISALEFKLHQSLELMQTKEKEMEALLTSIEAKDIAIEELMILNRSLVEEKEMLNQSVDALHAKTQMLAMAMESEKSVSKDLCNCVEEKDSIIASLTDELKNLQHLLNLSQSDSEKVMKYEEKLKNSEGELAETFISLRETEERLSASEWAVQQLANEVAKAKGSLVQKERDEVLLQSRLCDMETRSKAKERELVELDRYVQSLVNKNLHKQTEVERLTQAIEKLERKADEWNAEGQKLNFEMQQMGVTLEAKSSGLAHLEEQLKQSQSKETMMEDAIQCLKSQVASQVQLSTDRDSQIKQLLGELETAHTKEVLMVGSLNEAENKLQQADQRFKEETEKINKSLIETKEKLSSFLVKNSDLERDLLAAMQEIEKHKGKICTVSEIAAAKEVSFKDLTCKFDSLQEELEDEKKLTYQSNDELVLIKTELVSYQDKEMRLNEKICLLNEELEDQKKTLTTQSALLNAELCSKVKALELSHETIGIMSAEREALNDEVAKLKKEVEMSSVSLQARDAEIVRLNETRKGLETEMVKLREDRLKKEKDLESTFVQLESAEKKCSALEDTIGVLKEELANLTVQLRLQLQETNSLATSNTLLKQELEVKQNILKATDLRSRSELDCVNGKLDDYCRKEAAMQAQIAVLLKKVREILHLSRQHEAEASDILHALMQASSNGNDLFQSELARPIESSEELHLTFAKSGELECPETFLPLQLVVQELQTEEQRRRRIEAHVFEMARNVILKLTVKEQDLQGLMIELEVLKKREDASKSELEKAVMLAEKLNREVKSKEEANESELSRLREEAERARNLNNSLSEQLAEATVKIKAFVEKEQCTGGELRDARDKVKSIEEETSNLRLQLRKASEITSHLEHQVDEKKEELTRVQVQMSNLKLNLELETEMNGDLTVELAEANKQIEDLNLKLGVLEKEQASMQVDIDKWRESVSLAHNEKLALLSQMHGASQSSEEAIKRLEAEKHGLWLEVWLWKERAESSTKDNNLLKSQLEEYDQSVEDLQGRLRAAESGNEHLQSTCQKLKAKLISAQDASQQREKLLGDALIKIQQGSRQNRNTVESRLQVLYEAMTHDNEVDDDDHRDIVEDGSLSSNGKKDWQPLSLKTGSLSSNDGATLLRHQAIGDDCKCSKDAALSASSHKVEEEQDSIQDDLHHYLELCDSLIRRHSQLEKMLEKLETSNTTGRDQRHVTSEEAGGADGSENKKKRMLTAQEVGKSQGKEEIRKPLQPIVPISSQAVMASTPSPCAKRRRSNDNFQDQNACQ